MDSRLKSMSIEEASDFWDTHSLVAFPSHEVEIEYTPEGPAPLELLGDDDETDRE